eukprot:gene6988-12610_t
MKVKGSVSLITGGSQGFGRAFSRELLKRGGKVTVVDIDDETGLKTCKDFSKEFGEGSAHFIHCDVTNTDHLEGAFNETINKFGRLDILCNNAGGLVHNWKKLVELNLTSVIHGTFLGIKHMKAANKGAGGVIVNVGSLSGLFPFRDAPVYSATKFGVVGFTQSLKVCFKIFVTLGILQASSLLSHILMHLFCPILYNESNLSSLAPDVAPDVQQGAPLELIWLRFLGILIFHQKANTRENIRVNCLCPSFSPTTMVEKGLEARPEMRPFVEKIGIVPIEDVAKGFIELVHDDTKDGEVLTVTVKGLVYVKARHEHFPVEPKL